MFFLKELPTQAMITRYSDEFCPDQSQQIAQRLEGLREYSSLIRKLDDYFASHGLSQLRFLILMAIDRELDREWLYASELVSRLDVSKPVLSRAVKKLVEDALLCAKKDEDDGRAVTLALTKKSQALLKSILSGYFNILTTSQNLE